MAAETAWPWKGRPWSRARPNCRKPCRPPRPGARYADRNSEGVGGELGAQEARERRCERGAAETLRGKWRPCAPQAIESGWSSSRSSATKFPRRPAPPPEELLQNGGERRPNGRRCPPPREDQRPGDATPTTSGRKPAPEDNRRTNCAGNSRLQAKLKPLEEARSASNATWRRALQQNRA